MPKSIDEISDESLREELKLLAQIQPHSIITTNYDQFLEMIFPEYSPIIGQRVLRADHVSIGEIFKIHGCVSEFQDIVLTDEDYREFMGKKKYLTAKLLTYFAEHPLFFIGYKAEDKNIKSILPDIDEILGVGGNLINNVYLLTWDSKLSDADYPSREHLLPIDDGRYIRLKKISYSSPEWIFRAMATSEPLEKVNIKLLRLLSSRTYDLIRKDIPRRKVEVDYTILEHVVSEAGFPKIFGLTAVADPRSFNATFPYSLTQVAEKMGYKHWNRCDDLLKRIIKEKGKDIRASDNIYHVCSKVGKVTKNHKYSDAMVELLMLVRSGNPYEVDA